MKKENRIIQLIVYTLLCMLFHPGYSEAQVMYIYTDDRGKSGFFKDDETRFFKYADSNNIVIPAKYDDLDNFREGLAPVKLDGKWGYIDKQGKIVVPIKYDYAGYFNEGLGTVQMNKNWGFVDKTGKEIIPATFSHVHYFFEKIAAVRKPGSEKWGFIDRTGKEVTPFKYDLIAPFSDGRARVEMDKKFGYVDDNGKEIVPVIYENANDFRNGLAGVMRNKKWGLIDRSGKVIVTVKYDGFRNFREGMAIVFQESKRGFVDRSGKEVIPIIFHTAYDFSEGSAAVQDYSTKKFGFIDKAGKLIIPFKYQDIRPFNEGLAAIKLNNKWGFIDKTGKELITPQYDVAYSFYDGEAYVANGDDYHKIKSPLNSKKEDQPLLPYQDEVTKLYGYKNNSGAIIVLPKYSYGVHFVEGFAEVSMNKKWGFIDRTGKEILPPTYEGAWYLNKGVITAKLHGKWGLIDKTGRIIVPFMYDDAIDQGDITVVKLKQNWGIINRAGKIVVPIKYQLIESFKGGFAPCMLNDKWGYINQSAKEIVVPKYAYASDFDEGLAGVGLNGVYGSIDITGEEVISRNYDYMYPFSELRAGVRKNGKLGFIDQYGQEVIPPKYDKIGESTIFTYGLIAVSLNEKWGIIDRSGKEITPFKYQQLDYYSSGLIPFKINNKWGYLDRRGNEVISARYDEAESFYRGDSASVVLNGRRMMIAKPKIEYKGPSLGTNTAVHTKQTITRQNNPGMKGAIDPSIVGTWKHHDNSLNANNYYIFRADGTYDYWSDFITPTEPTFKDINFWSVDGDTIGFLPERGKEVVHLKVLKRNDPVTNSAALLIEWNRGLGNYRTYFPTEPKPLWKIPTATTTTKTVAIKPAASVKLVEPPVKLNGIVDLSIVGLWKTHYNNIDYYLDFKADGTYDTWSTSDSKKIKNYWRIDNGFMEVLYTGARKPNRFSFKKINDLATGRPTIGLDWSVYFSESDREMWK